MERLIDADKAIDAIYGCFNVLEAKGIDMTVARSIVKSVLDGAPTVNAVPVKWLRQKADNELLNCLPNIYGRGSPETLSAINKVLLLWRNEKNV